MSHSTTKKLFFSYMSVSPLCEASRRAIVRFLDDYVKVGPPEVIEKYRGYIRKLSEVERISFTHTTRETDLRKLVTEIKAWLHR